MQGPRTEHLAAQGNDSGDRAHSFRAPCSDASTTDVETASAALSDAYTDLTLRAPCPAKRFRMRLQSFELPTVRLAALNLSSSTIRTTPYPTYTVCLPVRGRVRATADNGSSIISGQHGIAVSPKSGEVLVEYLADDCEVFTVTFDRTALETELEMMLGRPVRSTVRFDLRLDIGSCGAFQRALALLRTELASPGGMAEVPLMSLRIARLVMAALLLGQPHEYSDELRRPVGFQGPRSIRLAVAAIEERPTEITTVADIANAANSSVRALEDGFRRHLGIGPMAYLRQVRMTRVFEELVAADPDVTRATVVAHKWGFAHYGRFAAQYRQRYGCTPSETLRSTSGADRPTR